MKRGRETNQGDSEAAGDWPQQEAWRQCLLVTGSPGEKALICSIGQFHASNSLTTSLQNSEYLTICPCESVQASSGAPLVGEEKGAGGVIQALARIPQEKLQPSMAGLSGDLEPWGRQSLPEVLHEAEGGEYPAFLLLTLQSPASVWLKPAGSS